MEWIKSSERLPDENVSVLCFIPEEDNHITTGMWDVSKKWVLLDEYRIPKSQVTHWMYMPVSIPEDQSFNKTFIETDELNDASTFLRTIQKNNFDLNKEIESLKKENEELNKVLNRKQFSINRMKSELSEAKERFCQCKIEDKHGSTSAMHCNHCGKLEQNETWLK